MKTIKKIGIIGAMESEVRQLVAKMSERQTLTACGRTFYAGKLCGKEVVVVKSGVGKVNSATCAQMLIDRFEITHLVNTGIAGGVGANLKVGDIVIGTQLCQHDFELEIFGYTKGNLGIGPKDRPTLFVSDENMVKIMKKVASEEIGADAVHEGIIASGDRFVATAATKLAIRDTFHAMAVEMEGGAIAHAAYLADIPFVVLRAISDLADGTASESFEKFEQETADLSATVMERFLTAF